MVNFLKKRLQVFVSSTYLDLKTERQAAVSAILTSGHIPAGMELFTAGDQSQMEVIKQWIDESDAFLLILGSRYGSIEPETGKSYTHLEYEYAVSKNKPLFACVIKESAIDNRVKELGRDCLELKNPQKLKDFRDLVLSKMSSFWSDTKDIELEVIKTLQTFSRREDLTGWVKGDESVDTVALTEGLARLSKENADLREQNQILSAQSNKPIDTNLGISFEEMQLVLQSERFNFGDFLEGIDPKLVQKEIKTKEFFSFLDTNNITVAKIEQVINQLELFNLLRKPLARKEIIFGVAENNLLRMVLDTLIMKNLVALDFIPNTSAQHTLYLSESGLKFSNWVDLQEVKSTKNTVSTNANG